GQGPPGGGQFFFYGGPLHGHHYASRPDEGQAQFQQDGHGSHRPGHGHIHAVPEGLPAGQFFRPAVERLNALQLQGGAHAGPNLHLFGGTVQQADMPAGAHDFHRYPRQAPAAAYIYYIGLVPAVQYSKKADAVEDVLFQGFGGIVNGGKVQPAGGCQEEFLVGQQLTGLSLGHRHPQPGGPLQQPGLQILAAAAGSPVQIAAGAHGVHASFWGPCPSWLRRGRRPRPPGRPPWWRRRPPARPRPGDWLPSPAGSTSTRRKGSRPMLAVRMSGSSFKITWTNCRPAAVMGDKATERPPRRTLWAARRASRSTSSLRRWR